MLKRKIKYVDYDGNDQEELYYFNLSKMEMMEMEVQGEGGSFAAWANRVVEANDRATLIKEFKSIILKAYGVRSEDGRAFVKNDEVREKFSQTAAFEALFLELAMNEGAAVEFLIGVLPEDIRERASAEIRGAIKTAEKNQAKETEPKAQNAPEPSPLSADG